MVVVVEGERGRVVVFIFARTRALAIVQMWRSKGIGVQIKPGSIIVRSPFSIVLTISDMEFQ